MHGWGPLGCGETVNHATVRLYSSLASLPHKEHPQDQPITNGGEEGVFSKSRLYRRVCDGPTCTSVYDQILISYCILKPKPPDHLKVKALSLSTHDFTSLTPIHSCFTSSPLPAGSTAQSSPSASHPPRLVLAGGFLLPL